MTQGPNFLTCPGVPELPEHAEAIPKPKPPSKPAKPFSFKPFLAAGSILLLLAVIILAAPSAYKMWTVYDNAQSVKVTLAQLQEAIKSGDFDTAEILAGKSKDQLADMQAGLIGMGFWREAPYVGEQLKLLEGAAGVGKQTLDGVQDVLAVAQAIQEAIAAAHNAGSVNTTPGSGIKIGDLSREQMRAMLGAWRNSLPELRLAREKIDIASQLWEELPKDKMAGPIQKALEPMAKLLPVLSKSLDQAMPLAELFAPLAGYPDAQNYLVVTQNADELRPAGGFIGSVMTLNMDSGQIAAFDFSDVYAIDNPAQAAGWKVDPPEPIATYLDQHNWYLRDANWSPDFYVSAEKVLGFFEQETKLVNVNLPPRTGLIAFEPGFFRALLGLTGPIIVQGKTFNEANFMDTLQYEVEAAEGITQENRKDIMGELAVAIIDRIRSLPAERMPALLDMLTLALERKQILIYSRDANTQAALDKYGWSARTKPTQGDFMWVSDANLASLKTDRAIRRKMSYEVDARDPKNVTATITLEYQNTTQQIDWRQTRYRDYTRVYVPEGSELINSQGVMADDLHKTGGKFVSGKVDVMKELGKTVFGAFWSIEPRKTGKLVFKYKLPAEVGEQIASGNYHLDWMKQPGVDDADLYVKILLPRTVVTAVPSEDEDKWGDAVYEVESDTLTDREFSVEF